jgi:hypothetical protein
MRVCSHKARLHSDETKRINILEGFAAVRRQADATDPFALRTSL